ncbi:MAG: DUF5011 domain-containing protein [bacterium]|nr:DUF5011 domain-containing protein [bacterium]
MKSIKKILYSFMVMMMVLQPVSMPGVLRAVAADEAIAEAVSASASEEVEEETEEETEESTPASEEEPAAEVVDVVAKEPAPVAVVEEAIVSPVETNNTETIEITDEGQITPEAAYDEKLVVIEPENTPIEKPIEVQIPLPEEVGDLNTIVVDNIKASSLNLDEIDPENIEKTANLATDKADYAPTDAAIITGTGFIPNQAYVLIISSKDTPPVTKNVTVTTAENGQFVYAYQLDGKYRPDYKVEAKNDSGEVIAEVAFTDSPVVSSLVINEIDYDQPSTDTAEFIEIKNTSGGSINLDNYELRFINGAASSVPYKNIDLPNVDLSAGDYYVVCSNTANVSNCDLDITPNTDLIQNGGGDPDAVALYNSSVLIDTVSYEGSVFGYTEGTGAQEDLSGVASKGLSRYPDGQDSYNNNADFSYICISPGIANANYFDCANPDAISPVLSGTPSPSGILNHNNANLNISFTDNLGFNTINPLANIKSYKIDGSSQSTSNGCVTISADGLTLTYACTVGALADGVHTLDFQVQDLSRNESSNASWTFTVDTTIPIISLVGENPQTIEEGTPYIDSGATATDDVDGDITDEIVVNNPVDVNVVGDYTVTYDVVDMAGNHAVQVTRTVKVLAKATEDSDPNEVRNLKAKYRSDTQCVKLSWDLNEDNADQTRIYRSQKSSFGADSDTEIERQDSGDKTFRDCDVSRGEKYYYKVVVLGEDRDRKSDSKKVSIEIPFYGDAQSGAIFSGGEGSGNNNQGDGTNDENPEVLGEQNQTGEDNNDAGNSNEDSGGSNIVDKWPWFLLGVIILGGGWYVGRRKK